MPVILWRTVITGWRRSIPLREPSMISMKVLFAASPKHCSSQWSQSGFVIPYLHFPIFSRTLVSSAVHFGQSFPSFVSWFALQ